MRRANRYAGRVYFPADSLRWAVPYTTKVRNEATASWFFKPLWFIFYQISEFLQKLLQEALCRPLSRAMVSHNHFFRSRVALCFSNTLTHLRYNRPCPKECDQDFTGPCPHRWTTSYSSDKQQTFCTPNRKYRVSSLFNAYGKSF